VLVAIAHVCDLDVPVAATFELGVGERKSAPGRELDVEAVFAEARVQIAHFEEQVLVYRHQRIGFDQSAVRTRQERPPEQLGVSLAAHQELVLISVRFRRFPVGLGDRDAGE
jgi:hypothetical protein